MLFDVYYVAVRWSQERIEGKAPLTLAQAIALLQANPSPYACRQVIDEYGRIVSIDELKRSLACRQQEQPSGSGGGQRQRQLSPHTPPTGKRLEVFMW